MNNNLIFPKLPRSKRDGNLWVVSDIHGWHKNIARGSSKWKSKKTCRPFDNQDEMTNHIVKNINNDVDENDYLLSLGDWSFGGYDNIEKLRSLIKCKNIYHVIGNHDEHIRKNIVLQRLFNWVGYYLEFVYDGFFFSCSHYPIESWNHLGKNGVMLYGHCHGSFKHKMSRRYEMCMECIDYRPMHIDELVKRAQSETPEKIDHH